MPMLLGVDDASLKWSLVAKAAEKVAAEKKEVSSEYFSEEAEPVKVPKGNATKEKWAPKEVAEEKKVPEEKVPKRKKADDSKSDTSVKAPNAKTFKKLNVTEGGSDSESFVKESKEKKFKKVEETEKGSDSDSDSGSSVKVLVHIIIAAIRYHSLLRLLQHLLVYTI